MITNEILWTLGAVDSGQARVAVGPREQWPVARHVYLWNHSLSWKPRLLCLQHQGQLLRMVIVIIYLTFNTCQALCSAAMGSNGAGRLDPGTQGKFPQDQPGGSLASRKIEITREPVKVMKTRFLE